MHLPASADGGPHQPIAPGGTWSPSWRIDQPAATLWYHPYPDGQTERHVYRGLAEVAGGQDSFDVLQLRAASTLARSTPPPERLVAVPRLDPAAAATTRSFRLERREINGKSMDMDRVDEVVTADSTEVWEVTNQHIQPHTFHVHGVQFQVLDIGGAAPPPPLSGWKDTVYLPPETPIRLIMRFGDYADPSQPYMFHCHLLFHEDMGMMGQYLVVRPGQQPQAPASDDHSHHH
jgi:FtsP/CotA-like multicopper oxidase with cupredoxin domain